MSRVLADTSALVAFQVGTDLNHERARRTVERLKARAATLLSPSYVLLETYALLGRRFGPAGMARFRADIAPMLSVVWVTADHHERALELLLKLEKRHLSLVDASCFVIAREQRIDEVFAFDRHFKDAGFTLV